MENQQDCILSNNQKQVLFTGEFGDGCLVRNSKNSYYQCSSMNKDLLQYKVKLLGELVGESPIKIRDNSKGYSKSSIYHFTSKTLPSITKFHNLSLEDKLREVNELGIALWFYDDGSLHKKNNFYNLCTHKFSLEVHNDLLVPFFENLGISPKVTIERKKDGRLFYYLRFGRHDGAYEINEILRKYYVPSMDYKMWSSETSLEWRKLQAELKSDEITVSKRKFSNLLNERLSKI